LTPGGKKRDGLAAIVLAAGLGTRMVSARAKVLHELAGEALIVRSLRPLVQFEVRPVIVVVGHQASEVEAVCRRSFADADLSFCIQREQQGTGDAARCGIGSLDSGFDGLVLITYGDLPNLRRDVLRAFVEFHRRGNAVLSFISLKLEDPGQYGRVVRDSAGAVRAIVEARDASAAEKKIKEINTGVYVADASFLRIALAGLESNNAQKEYYLTDLVAIARDKAMEVGIFVADNSDEFAGINSREELAHMEADIRSKTNRKLMAAGVTMIDPGTCYVSEQVEIGADTVIGPNVQILGRSRIGSGVTIEGTAWLRDVSVGDRCHLKLGVRAEECVIGEDCEIGPFANLRTGTELEGHNRIGNFVETKKARIGRGTKANHLSYLGDTIIGRETNIGCGVITVNYDGYDKHLTQIGDRCMVGCDSQFIAPIKIGNDVYVASGTTIVREVPEGALVMSHHPQREKAGWMEGFHSRHAGRSPWWSKGD
jgi:bifunctional UDP-N-acetylglucosamine pyrophosphorylase/glucosamine-1-phosphate N-acetyltransferase